MGADRGDDCPTCAEPVTGTARFCGRCGAHLPGVDEPVPGGGGVAPSTPTSRAPGEVVPPEASPIAATSPPGRRSERFDRRTLLAGLGGLVVGGAVGTALSGRRQAAWPADADGIPIAQVEVGDAAQIAEQLADGGVLRVPEDAGRIAVVRWDPSYVSDLGSAMDHYGPDGEGHPILSDQAGLLALIPASTHLGCSVHYCETSGWFEDPCHGATWNSWGEWTFGPAPRGLDRYRSNVREDGILIVDLARQIVGPSREAGVLDQPPEGPHCVDG